MWANMVVKFLQTSRGPKIWDQRNCRIHFWSVKFIFAISWEWSRSFSLLKQLSRLHWYFSTFLVDKRGFRKFVKCKRFNASADYREGGAFNYFFFNLLNEFDYFSTFVNFKSFLGHLQKLLNFFKTIKLIEKY